MKISKVKLNPANCAVDLGDGSERGPYVNQDYVLNKMTRPHRGINLMYCYYPLDETFPVRASEAHTGGNVSFAWDFAYDDYFTYKGGLEGNRDDEPFTCMRDVRKHGQDVILTLTCDPHVSDEQIIAICKDLRTFGRIYLRLNHEATGDWFSFNKRASYEEVGAFFAHFADILHREAPNVKIILCIDGIMNLGDEKVDKEDAFADAIKKADVWSTDKYIALNWGWPYEVAEKDNNQHKLDDIKELYAKVKATYLRFKEVNGGISKPMLISEFNADGDVTGPYKQAKLVEDFCELIKNDPEKWFSGITMYQFRDNGRLGLEFTDPNNDENGFETPLMKSYLNIINDDYFKPTFSYSTIENENEIEMRWGGSEDSDGISIELNMPSNPEFAEANFNNSLTDMNLVMEINGKWFYKAPGVKYIDFMPAFFNKDLKESVVRLNIFAPPASGENNITDKEDWDINYYTKITELPDIRLRFEPIM